MGKIVWLASYPKSGNTWMRVLLTNYLRDADTPADINQLDGGPIASARLWFDEWAGIEASALSDTVIERLRPDVYRCMAAESRDTLYMKVHDAWSRTDQGTPLFPPDVSSGVVYVLRNPLDMAVSSSYHWGITVDKAVEKICDSSCSISRSFGGLSNQLRQFMGSWSDHVRSWVDEAGVPCHVARYEDLLRQPEATFGEVVRFLGLSHDEMRVRKAVVFSNFAELRRQEKEKGFREDSANASDLFFRRGQSGAWREELSSVMVRQIIEVHGTMMKRFGYLDENNAPT